MEAQTVGTALAGSRTSWHMHRAVSYVALIAILTAPTPASAKGRQLSDWSRVEALAEGTGIQVRLFRHKSPRGARRIRGRLVSATSTAIQVSDGSSLHEFKRADVQSVGAQNPKFSWYYWAILGGWLAATIGLPSGLGTTVSSAAAATGFLLIRQHNRVYVAPAP